MTREIASKQRNNALNSLPAVMVTVADFTAEFTCFIRIVLSFGQGCSDESRAEGAFLGKAMDPDLLFKGTHRCSAARRGDVYAGDGRRPAGAVAAGGGWCAGVGAKDGMQTFLVVDDHPLVRHGFALSVGEIRSDAVVIEAGSLEEALDIVRRTPALTLALFDLQLAHGRGGVGVQRMVEALDGRPLLVISESDDVQDIIESVRLGARGYILKTSSTAVLEHAISLALTGETFLPLPRAVLSGTLAPEAAQPSGQPFERLTGRQRDVFHLLLSGHSNKEIARELGVLEGTVKVHVRAIMQKLGVRNRTQVAVAAARSGRFPEDG